MKLEAHELTVRETEELVLALITPHYYPPRESRMYDIFNDYTKITTDELFDYLDKTIPGWLV